MKIELHLLQNVAPACLNRDDTNTPKDCEFGGHRRARISSQALKRSIRLSPIFKEVLQADLGIRTKKLVSELTKRLAKEGKEAAEAESIATGFVGAAMSEITTGAENRTKVLLYLGEDEMERMGKVVLENYDKLLNAKQSQEAKGKGRKDNRKATKEKDVFKDECKEVARGFQCGTKAPDIALFGRMMAEHPEAGVDAACQVAHAISTNKVSMEMDYYTAVDDLSPKEETGAGMLGFTAFNSSCFYRYATIDFHQLRANLGGDVDLANKAVEAFIHASVVALPSGKQNAMAAHNPPEAVLAVVRNGGTPVSLANAFCKPVHPGRDSDLMSDSIRELDAYWSRLTGVYGSDGIAAKAICTVTEVTLEHLADAKKDSLAEVMQCVRETLRNLSDGGAA